MIKDQKEELILREKIIDNRGLSCPLPVINTKKALDELIKEGIDEFSLMVIVDNEAAKENVMRFASTAGYQTTAERKEEGICILIEKSGSKDNEKEKSRQMGELCCGAKEGTEKETLVMITSSALGQGSEELENTDAQFYFHLKRNGAPPAKILFLNSGVFLTTEGSPVLDELQELAERGVEIFSCGTCLDYYKLKEKLAVGHVTNMYDTVEAVQAAAKVITL